MGKIIEEITYEEYSKNRPYRFVFWRFWNDSARVLFVTITSLLLSQCNCSLDLTQEVSVEVELNGVPENTIFDNNNSYIDESSEFTNEPPSITPTRRNIAEFEPMQAVLIRYSSREGFGLPIELIAEMSKDIQIVTIVGNIIERQEVINLYVNNGVKCSYKNCIFMNASSDSMYTRDYGPWFVIDEAANCIVVDFIFNLDRPRDNMIPKIYASWQEMDIDFLKLRHAGGNYMTDGQGIAISTDSVIFENLNKTIEQIDKEMYENLGIHTYYKLEDALNTEIHHIDSWAKLLAPDKIMIIDVPEEHPSHDKLDEFAIWFSEQAITCQGNHYTVYRVEGDPANNEVYTCCLILNNKVLLPFTGNSIRDNAAKLSFENAMPGYQIFGFEAPSNREWLIEDGLHCRVIGIPSCLPYIRR